MWKPLRWLSSKYWEWWFYFKSRTRQLLSRFWLLLHIYSMFVFFLSAVYIILVLLQGDATSLGASEGLDKIMSVMVVVAAIAIFGFSFILLFVLSLFPKGRKIADKIFKFTEFTRLEILEEKVEKIEDDLALVNTKLANVENRLGNIETTLNSLVGSVARLKRHPKRKPKQTRGKK